MQAKVRLLNKINRSTTQRERKYCWEHRLLQEIKDQERKGDVMKPQELSVTQRGQRLFIFSQNWTRWSLTFSQILKALWTHVVGGSNESNLEWSLIGINKRSGMWIHINNCVGTGWNEDVVQDPIYPSTDSNQSPLWLWKCSFEFKQY